MDETRICSLCGCTLGDDETTEVNDDPICDHCAEEHTVACSHCGDIIWQGDAISDSRIHVCESCYDNHYRRCEGCGCILYKSDVVWYNDSPYCEHCYDRLDVEIEEYSYKPDPIFYCEGKRFFGVELEVDDGGKYEESACRIKNQTNCRCEHIYIKSDGSLDDGFEIVTHPMSLDYHINCMYWGDVLREAIRLGYRSHMTSTCGLHIHVNRDAFGESYEEQERIIEKILFFTELHWNELFVFSRKSPHSMNRWAARYGIEKTGKEILDKAKKGNTGRYAAINLCPYATIEFRLFRGTLKLNTLIATLQLVNKTALQNELNSINDGTAIFRDASFAEEQKRRNASLNVLLQDLNCTNGNESASRHLIVVVSDNPSNLSSELPAYFISLGDQEEIHNVRALQQAVGEFDYALLKYISDINMGNNPVKKKIERYPHLHSTNDGSEHFMTERMLQTTVELLYDYQLLSYEEKNQITNYIQSYRHEEANSDQTVSNEFRKILSQCIEDGKISIANQSGPPYFRSKRAMVLLDSDYINIMASTLDDYILRLMKTTQKRNKLLQSLNVCGKLYANNHYKRNIDAEVAPGVTETVSVYSFPKDILTPKCQAMVRAVSYTDYLFRQEYFPKGFIPLVCGDNTKAAGRVYDEQTDEATSIYVSGQTRSGKTRFLVQQAVMLAASGDKVIIFDQTGAFTLAELKKHLPEDIVENYFSHWEIGHEGLPIDLLSLEHCTTLPEKKNRLFNIFSVAAKITGEEQGKVLRKRLSDIVKAIDAGKISDLAATLSFFDENDPDQADIKERLVEVFDDLEGLEVHHQNWCEFLDTQKKIVVISTSTDGIRKSSQLIDELLASLYTYKQYDRSARYTVILDEIEDLCLEKDGPISTILRKGGKHRLSMLLASQEFSAEKDRLGKLIGNCGMLVFFRPKDANLSVVAKHINYDRQLLANLEQGEFVAVGGLYSHSKARNHRTTIMGRSYPAQLFLRRHRD